MTIRDNGFNDPNYEQEQLERLRSELPPAAP